MRARPRGFTLVEMLVALTLTALIAMIAHATIGGLVRAHDQVEEARRTLDDEMTGRAWFTSAVSSMDGGGGFVASADSATFRAWLPVPGGWMEADRMTLILRADSLQLRTAGRTETIATRLRAAHLDYLREPGLGGTFVTDWNSQSLPYAVRLRTVRESGLAETTFVVVGDRG